MTESWANPLCSFFARVRFAGVLLLVSVRHRVHSACTARTEVIEYAKRSGETPRIVFGRWTSNLQRGARRLCRNSLMFFLGTERNTTAAQTQ